MSILEQLDHPEFRPSKSDKLLMAYIKKNAPDVPHTAIAKLAITSGVGEATITRFVKKMGFASLQAFKLALAEELTEGTNRYIINSSISCGESALVTGRKLLDANIGTLEKTLASLMEGSVESCAALMRSAKRLRFIGLGNSGFVAQDTAYKFYRIGFESLGLDNSHTMLIMASLAGPGDVIVAVSHSGKSPEVLKTVKLAQENGARAIAITSNKSSGIGRIANIHITYEAKESMLETGSITTKLAQFFIMDLIYTQIVKEMSESAAENKQKTAVAMEFLRQ
jgi:DNA-binding MurR/RpiR family transcriptional regulator